MTRKPHHAPYNESCRWCGATAPYTGECSGPPPKGTEVWVVRLWPTTTAEKLRVTTHTGRLSGGFGLYLHGLHHLSEASARAAANARKRDATQRLLERQERVVDLARSALDSAIAERDRLAAEVQRLSAAMGGDAS